MQITFKPHTFGNTVLNYMTTGTHNGLLITIIHFSLEKDSLSYRIKWGKNLIIKANDEDSLISFLVPKLIKLSKHSWSQYLQKISHFPLFLRVSVENPVCTTDLYDSFISRLLNRWSWILKLLLPLFICWIQTAAVSAHRIDRIRSTRKTKTIRTRPLICFS